MKSLLVYSSLTGNTQAVANAVHGIMPPSSPLFSVQHAPDPMCYDILILGFWVHRSQPDVLMQRYMRRIQGKTVILFGTMAAYPESAYAEKVQENAVACLQGNHVPGIFLCQGKLAPKRFAALMDGSREKPAHPMTPERRARLREAEKHPNEHDFATARHTIAQLLQQQPHCFSAQPKA